MNPCLVSTKRRVRRTGEARAQAEVCGSTARIGLRIVPSVTHHDLGTGPIVRGKEDHGVLEHTHGLELIHKTPHLAIDPIHHGRVNRHFRGLESTLLIGQIVPRQRAIDLTGPQFPERIRKVIRRPHIRFQPGQGGVDDPQFLLPDISFPAHRVPTVQVGVSVACNIFRQGVQRKMRCNKGHIMKERTIGVLILVFLQAVDRMIDRGNGGVVIRFICCRGDGLVVDPIGPG